MIKTLLLNAIAFSFIISPPLLGSIPQPCPIEKGAVEIWSPPRPAPVEQKGIGYAEFKIGYYQFQNGTLRQIFDKGGVNYGGEIGYILPNSVLGFWINGFYFENDGQAIENGPKVRMQLGTIAPGIRLLYRPVKCFDLFAGVGPRIFIPKIKNESSYVQKWDQRVQLGGAFSAGFTLHSVPAWPRFWLEFFFDYSLFLYNNYPNSVSSVVYDVNFSFWNVGGSVGFSF